MANHWLQEPIFERFLEELKAKLSDFIDYAIVAGMPPQDLYDVFSKVPEDLDIFKADGIFGEYDYEITLEDNASDSTIKVGEYHLSFNFTFWEDAWSPLRSVRGLVILDQGGNSSKTILGY